MLSILKFWKKNTYIHVTLGVNRSITVLQRMRCNPTVMVKSSDSDPNLAHPLTVLEVMSINNKPQSFVYKIVVKIMFSEAYYKVLMR